jgi:hypothetical protein
MRVERLSTALYVDCYIFKPGALPDSQSLKLREGPQETVERKFQLKGVSCLSTM